MSNVYSKDRKTSPMEVVTKSRDLYVTVYKICMNEDKVPKKHRYFIGKKLVDLTEEIMGNIIKANAIFPRTDIDKELRYKHQKEAYACCECLLSELEAFCQIISISYKDTENITQLAVGTMQMIQAWIKSDNR